MGMEVFGILYLQISVVHAIWVGVRESPWDARHRDWAWRQRPLLSWARWDQAGLSVDVARGPAPTASCGGRFGF